MLPKLIKPFGTPAGSLASSVEDPPKDELRFNELCRDDDLFLVVGRDGLVLLVFVFSGLAPFLF